MGVVFSVNVHIHIMNRGDNTHGKNLFNSFPFSKKCLVTLGKNYGISTLRGCSLF